MFIIRIAVDDVYIILEIIIRAKYGVVTNIHAIKRLTAIIVYRKIEKKHVLCIGAAKAVSRLFDLDTDCAIRVKII